MSNMMMGGQQMPDGSRSSAIEQLEMRYARGEIDRDEYLQRRDDLEHVQPAAVAEPIRPGPSTQEGNGMRQLPIHDGGASCTLDEQGAARRNVEFADIARRGLRDHGRTDDGDVRLTFDEGEQVEEAVRQVFARESKCCGFFTFNIREEGDELVVTATAPDDKADYLDALYRAADPDRTPDGTGTANDHSS